MDSKSTMTQDMMSGYSQIDPNAKLLALTFDDGPVEWDENSTAMKILHTFKEYGQRATFFYVGQNINPINSKEILYAQEIGCEIANHTWSHPNLTTLSKEEVMDQVNKTSEALSQLTGQSSFLFRLPYLSYNDQVLSLVNAPCIQCSVDTFDWNQAKKEEIIDHILAAHHKGILENSIVLLHEPYQATQEAIAHLVPQLIEEGYQLVTVSELAAARGVTLTKGQVYQRFDH